MRTQKPQLEQAALTDNLTRAKTIGFLMKNEDSLQFPHLLYHHLLPMALNKGYPDPQLTMHKHLVHSPV
jgi:hypothetical protein